MRLVEEVQDRALLLLLIAGKERQHGLDGQEDYRLVKDFHPASDSSVQSGLQAACIEHKDLAACAYGNRQITASEQRTMAATIAAGMPLAPPLITARRSLRLGTSRCWPGPWSLLLSAP